MHTMAPFTKLPIEVLESIFLLLDDPQSFLAVSQANRFIKDLTTDAPLIWRHFCRTHFRFWAPHHDIAAKLEGPLSSVDWRALFIQRVNVEQQTLRLLDQVLATPHNRIKHMNEIAKFGYDTKDVLLRECASSLEKNDVLARRWYADAILQRVQREMAIEVWKELDDGADVSIERALAAYDVFTRTHEDADFDKVSEVLDRLANRLLKEHPGYRDLSTRIKASTLASFLHEQGFCGVTHSSYRNLSNSFISLVLHSERHESLPLISAAIYCALARRVGLDARPCGFLFHVYCIIYAPQDWTLDGIYKPSKKTEVDFMYLDPFRSSDEVPVEDLRHSLREMGIPTSQHPSFLSDTTVQELVLRAARNILNSVQAIHQSEDTSDAHPMWVQAVPDMDSSFYSTIWSKIILGPDGTTTESSITSRWRQYLPYLIKHLQAHYPWDVPLLEKYIIPMFSRLPDRLRLEQFVETMQRNDETPKPARRRGRHSENVKYKVGQVFTHTRYRYEGVIIGWDTSCDLGEDWARTMNVDSLARGRNQAFYHVM